MRYSLIYIIPIILFIFLASGCSDRGSVDRLDRAEQIMEEHPDSALMLIQGVDASRLRSDKHRALYALLRTQALVKNDSAITSDSLIRTAVDYYTRHPKAPYLMKSVFYLGEVQRNIGNLTSAIKSSTQAYDLACQADDPYWIAKSAEQLMFIYSTSYGREQSKKFSKIASIYYKKAGKDLNHLYSLCDYCIDLADTNDKEKAFALTDSLIQVVEKNYGASTILAYIYQVRQYTCSKLRDTAEMEECDKKIRFLIEYLPITPNELIFERVCQLRKGECDNAEKGLLELQNSTMLSGEKAGLYQAFIELYTKKGDYYKVSCYLDSVLTLQNEEVTRVLSNDIALAQKEYYDQNYRAEETRSRNYRNLIIEILIISIIVILIILVILKIIVTHKNEKIENKIKDILILSSQLKDNETERLRILGALTDKEKESTTLYKDQWTTLNMLCREYFEKGDSDTVRATILKSVESRIKELNSPKSIKSLEDSVNKYMHDIIARLRNQADLLKFNDADVKFMTLCCAGFAPRAVCLLMDITLNNYYTKKRRLVERIQRHSVVLSEDIKRYL